MKRKILALALATMIDQDKDYLMRDNISEAQDESK